MKSYYDYAMDDFNGAEILLNNSNLWDKVGALCSESAEKFMKHILNEYELGDSEELHSHNLNRLSKIILKNFPNFSDVLNQVRSLNGYYFTLRYPSKNGEYLDKQDAIDSYNALVIIKNNIDTILGLEQMNVKRKNI